MRSEPLSMHMPADIRRKLAAATLVAVMSFGATAAMPVGASADDGYSLPAFAGGGQSEPAAPLDADTAADVENGEPTAVRDGNGRVSYLSTDTHNPYNGQNVVVFDLGAEFADYDGGDVTEAIVVKCSAGDVIELPKVKARSGYIFLGWGTGGIPEDIQWGTNMREMELSEALAEKNKEVYIYAIYADEQGNGYCTCGSYREGAYTGQVEELRADYEQYLDRNFGSRWQPASPLLAGAMLSLSLAVLLLAMRWLDNAASAYEKEKSKNPPK